MKHMPEGPRKVSLFVILLGIVCGAQNGNQTQSSLNPFETSRTYFSTMTTLNVEVAFEPNATPFAGNGFAQPLWNFLTNNLKALYQGRALIPTFQIPTTTAEMQTLPSLNKNTWTTSELASFASALRKNVSNNQTGDFFILFLNGYLDNGA